MGAEAIDSISLNFNPASLRLLEGILALVMFGVALDLRLSAFKRVLQAPWAPLIGLVAQFLVLPAATFGLTMLLRGEPFHLHPSIALGMILVAACPGGTISNFITHLAKGNTAVSVSMTAISTALAVIFTPLNISFWGKLNPDTSVILTRVALDPVDLFITVFLILGLPLALGLLISHKAPGAAYRLKKPFRYFSIGFFLIFVLAALAANFDNFLNYVGLVAFVVFLHNATALGLGYSLAFVARLPEFDRRAVAIEVGIQNSGLGLTLIFSFFGGLGGMALIAAWWGIWHIISGLSLALIWGRRALPEQLEEAVEHFG